jgi:hypothetical protein
MVQRRNRKSWAVLLALQAVLLVSTATSYSLGNLHAAGMECPTATDASSTDSCPDCSGAICESGTCPAPCGTFALPMGTPDVVRFLTIEKTALPILLFAASRTEPPLHPPPIV